MACYFAFGNKPSLLKEVVDVAIAGDDEPAHDSAAPDRGEPVYRRDAPDNGISWVVGVHQHQPMVASPRRQYAGQRGDRRPIRPVQPRSNRLPAQHCDLVSQYQQLLVLAASLRASRTS
jgi:hypothetical protein